MLINKEKTNWSMIAAVLAIAVVAGGGLIFYINDTIAQTRYLGQ